MDRHARKDEFIKLFHAVIREAAPPVEDNMIITNALLELAAMIVAAQAVDVDEATQEIVTVFPQIVAAYRSN